MLNCLIKYLQPTDGLSPQMRFAYDPAHFRPHQITQRAQEDWGLLLSLVVHLVHEQEQSLPAVDFITFPEIITTVCERNSLNMKFFEMSWDDIIVNICRDWNTDLISFPQSHLKTSSRSTLPFKDVTEKNNPALSVF